MYSRFNIPQAACLPLILTAVLLWSIEGANGQRTCTTALLAYRVENYAVYYIHGTPYGTCCGFLCWSRCTYHRYRHATRLAQRTVPYYYTGCCSGYGGYGCYATCSQGCVNGVCSSPNICTCITGWEGYRCETDIDECQRGTHTCHENATCSNTPGSFTCTCNDGYVGDGNTCTDTNECQYNNGGCEEGCINTVGSYMCTCDPSEKLEENERNCTDRNECEEGIALCNQTCVNTDGSYYCTCERGYQRRDFSQCEDTDECETLPNGLCQHICTNTIGSYFCECRDGFRKVGQYLCEDINECEEQTDNCSRTGPAQAACINGIGDYRCSCDNYVGFKLGSDYSRCIDLDECSENLHACSDMCINVLGTYTCSCSEGFGLESDQRTCTDIDECLHDNGGCDHICTNSVGSFACSCNQGYELEGDGFTCEALSCPLLEAPMNGSIDCSTQTVGGTCNYSCDPTFTLRGSVSRNCLPSVVWTGRPAICDPPMCPELTAPENGFVLYPCTGREMDTCDVICAPGFSLSGNSEQTCELNSTSDVLMWSVPPTCEERDLCSPNPCSHDGTCIEAGNEFICDCSGTNYTGPTCDIGIIRIPPIPTLTKGQSQSITVSTDLDLQGTKVKILVRVDDNPGPRITLQNHRKSHTFSLRPTKVGIIKITYDNSPQFAIQPSESTVFVKDETDSINPPNFYFRTLQLNIGQLKAGCCTSEGLQLECPESTEQVTLKASCQWNTENSIHLAPGIIFAEGNNISLPASISGYQVDASSRVLSQLGPISGCTQCASSQSLCQQQPPFDSDCYCYSFSASDTQDLLNTRALSLTYIEEIQALLPTWLKLQVNLRYAIPTTQFADFDYFTPIVQSYSDIPSIKGCNMISATSSGMYSILRHDKTISAEIEGDTYIYNENSAESDENPMCFAVNLCEGINSPLFMQVSKPVHNILISEYLNSFIRKGWRILLNTITVSKSPMSYTTLNQFWNGIEYFHPPTLMFDLAINTNTETVFGSENLNISMAFSGDVHLQYQERVGYLTGQTTLRVESKINEAQQTLYLNELDESYVTLKEENQCVTSEMGQISQSGISIRTTYRPVPSEPFFSRLFLLSEVTQECSCDVFAQIDGEYNVHAFRMYTECPILSLGKLFFPGMTHMMHFTGSASDCFQYDTLGVPNPGLVISSNLKEDRLPLGHFLELQKRRDGDDMTVVFSRNQGGFVAVLHSVKVTMFGGSFMASARIENNVLEIYGGTTVFQYPAHVHISALINETDWNDLFFTVHGSMDNGINSFVTTLQSEVFRQLNDTATSGNSRKTVAEKSLRQASERLNQMEDQYNSSIVAVNEANETYKAAVFDFEIAEDRLRAVQSVFDSASEELREFEEVLDMVCTEKVCENTCMSGFVNRVCYRQTFITKTADCPAIVKETRVEEVPCYYFTTEWQFITKCSISPYISCYGLFCCFGFREVCTSLCVPFSVQRSFTKTVNVEVEVVGVKSCTVEEYDSSVPYNCPEPSDCAILVPNITCVQSNALCRRSREVALQNVQEAREDIRKPFRDLQEARRNLSLAQTSMTSAKTRLESNERRRNALIPTLENLKNAENMARQVHKQTLQQIEPLIELSEIISENGGMLEEVFTVNDANFSTEFTLESPGDLPITIFFNTANTMEPTKEDFMYFELLGVENIREIADYIVESAFIRRERRQVVEYKRQKRQSVDESSNRLVFGQRCTHVTNTQLFLSDIEAKLLEIQQSLDAAYENEELLLQQNSTEVDVNEAVNLAILETEFNVSLTDEEAIEDEEVNAYMELLAGYKNLSAERLSAMEEVVFVEWQASMEQLYSESGSVGVYPCNGFGDCLQTLVDELRKLIALTPEPDAQILFELPMAEEQLLELSFGSNLTIGEALKKIAPIMDILNSYATNNYWCNTPPVITLQPPTALNVSLGSTLQLTCEASSELPLTYEWRKDGNTLPGFNTSHLVVPNMQHLDSGNYSCVMINPVGSVRSVSTSVMVYELPSFYLLPQSVATYFGNDSGAWFACNASAWPYPGWRWYYRASEDMEWMLIEGEETNEIIIPKPQMEQEGWYTCEAYNYHGSIRANPVSLVLLPFSISQQQHPLEFSIFTNDLQDQSCSLEELYKAVYRKISEAIDSDTTVIFGLSITEVDLQNDISETIGSGTTVSSGLTPTEVDLQNYDISVGLASENVTTSYLHLLLFEEIANLALPTISELQKSVESVTEQFEQENASIACVNTTYTIVPDSLIFDIVTYLCPTGQQLSPEYLLCVSCEPGTFSSLIDVPRIFVEEGIIERVPVCQPCPPGTYTEEIGSGTCKQCPKYHTTYTSGASLRESCIPQPLLLECEASTSDGHVTVDCQTNRPPVITTCSFDDGPEHECTYPLVITLGVSSPGSHMVRIMVTDDEDFTAEDVTEYFIDIESDQVTTVPVQVPPLMVHFINNSPRVSGAAVEADIVLSRPAQSLVCTLRSASVDLSLDCTNGHVQFSNLEPGYYTLKVIAANQVPDKELIRRRIYISDDPTHCSIHLINSGVIVAEGNVTVEFSGVGPASGHKCKLDRGKYYPCSSPVTLSGLTIGSHELRVVPSGCGPNRKILKVEFGII